MVQNNVDFDQLILEFYNPDDPAGGWVHVSYNESGSNRKQDYIPSDGYKRNAKGSLINRQTTTEQKKLKVKIIYATI